MCWSGKLLLVLARWEKREWRGCVGVKSAGVGDVFRSELTCWSGPSGLSVRDHKSSPCVGNSHFNMHPTIPASRVLSTLRKVSVKSDI